MLKVFNTKAIIKTVVVLGLVATTIDIGYYYYSNWGTKQGQIENQSRLKETQKIRTQLSQIPTQIERTEFKRSQSYQELIQKLAKRDEYEPLQSRMHQYFQVQRPKIDVTVNQALQEIASVYKTLEERRYRLRHTFKTFQDRFRSVAEEALIRNDAAPLTRFLDRVDEMQAAVESSQIRDDYKQRVHQGLDNLVHILKWGSLGQEPSVISKADIEGFKSILSEIQTPNVENLYSQSQQLSGLTDFLWSRVPAYFGLFALVLMGMLSFYLSTQFHKFGAYMQIGARFRKKLKQASDTEKKYKVLQDSIPTPTALVTSEGKVIWCSHSFAHFFDKKISQIKNWEKIKRKRFVSIESETGVSNAYKLVGNLERDVIVEESNYSEECHRKVVQIKELKSYFNEVAMNDFNGRNFTSAQVGSQACLFENVASEFILESTPTYKNLKMSLTQRDQMPRVLLLDEEVIQDCLKNVLQSLNSAVHLKRYGHIPVEMDYEKHKNEINLIFKLKKNFFDGQVLEQNLKYSPSAMNLSDAFARVENKFSPHGCHIKVYNIYSDEGLQQRHGEIRVRLSEFNSRVSKSEGKTTHHDINENFHSQEAH